MLNPDFSDMLSAFNAAKVDYLVVGAYAVGAHGLPRSTGDIDLWIDPTPENAKRASGRPQDLADVARLEEIGDQ